jgi:uncharacterized membrane protein
LFFYSFLGFTLESEIFKLDNCNIHSGIFYGPITEVYGFGVISLILLKTYFLDKLHCNKYLKLIIVYITSLILLTLIEYLGGNILNLIFNIDMWDYTKKTFNYGKYICLELSLIWGILGTIFIYYFKSFGDKIIKLIPHKITYIVIIINIIDTILTLTTK